MNASTASSLMQVGATVGALGIGAASAVFARRAAKLSAPTGNGWTEGLGKRLDQQDILTAQVAASLTRVETKIDEHLRDHAFSRPRSVRAVREKDSA